MKTKAILQYLLEGNELSSLTAVKLFKTIKLTTRVSEFRRSGHKIKDRWETNEKTKTRYKVYYV
jgi:hypothetical protein